MPAAPTDNSATPVASAPLPDFCSLPTLFALLLVGAITACLMWLAPGGTLDVGALSVGVLYTAWLSILLTVVLCKSQPLLQRLPGVWPYAAVWLLLLAIVGASSATLAWLDHDLRSGLTPVSVSRFVRDTLLATGLLGAALLRYFYVVAQWQARLAAAAQAQVAALQARIRPHFLFNSMNAVAALIRVDPDAAERTVENLAELFRAALGSEGAAQGTLGEEFRLVDQYLEIESLRLGGRLRVERDIDVPDSLPMPRLLLQPLVENAIRHGIQPSLEGGVLRLAGQRVAGGVSLTVDNPVSDAPAVPGTGHGLRSVRERVRLHFGERARVHAEAREGRFVVTLFLPEVVDARPRRR
ncbi:histidine kinase [Bacillus sp. NP157]|nr:histidine kinase [Bacillus sp. NP157]